jgi:hypothetical protein
VGVADSKEDFIIKDLTSGGATEYQPDRIGQPIQDQVDQLILDLIMFDLIDFNSTTVRDSNKSTAFEINLMLIFFGTAI